MGIKFHGGLFGSVSAFGSTYKFSRGDLQFQQRLNLARRFNDPGVEGLSPEELAALERSRQNEADRRQRLAQSIYERGRVALGVSGGQRSLLFGGFQGVTRSLGGVQTPSGGS